MKREWTEINFTHKPTSDGEFVPSECALSRPKHGAEEFVVPPLQVAGPPGRADRPQLEEEGSEIVVPPRIRGRGGRTGIERSPGVGLFWFGRLGLMH